MGIRFSSSFSFCNNPKIRNIRFNRDSLLLLFGLITCGRYQTARERESRSREMGNRPVKRTQCTRTAHGEKEWELEEGGAKEKEKHDGGSEMAPCYVGGPDYWGSRGSCAGVRLNFFFFHSLLFFFISKSKVTKPLALPNNILLKGMTFCTHT
ncbi:hypothetical protein LZ31DRAFT_185155 [Colletotrichum somersetense]|nr:hypothetical protein LZ31DRAFT_185155 [Colletotrichum somersetense]